MMVSSYTLESFLNIAHFLNELHVEDYAIAVADLNKYLGYFPGIRINHNVKLGDKVKEGSAINLAMTEKKRIVKVIDSSLYGFPYFAVAIPIIEKGWVIGGVCFMESIERREQLLHLTQGLYKDISHLHSSYQVIAAECKEYVWKTRELNKLLDTALRNASSGRELAYSTKEFISKIEIMIAQTIEELRRIEQKSGNQARRIQEISETVDKVYEMIERIRNEVEWFVLKKGKEVK